MIRTARRRILHHLWLGFAILVLNAGTGWAQSWTLEYDASLGSLPSAQSWTHVVDDPAPDDALDETNYSVAANVLTQGDTGGTNTDPTNLQYYESLLQHFDFDSEKLVLDVRMRVITSTQILPINNSARAGFAVRVTDVNGVTVILYVGTGGAFLDTPPGIGIFSALDTTDAMHDYRVEIEPWGATLFVDDVEIGTLDLEDFDNIANSLTDESPIHFGDVQYFESSSTEIERLSLAGFEVPVAEVLRYEVVSETSPDDSDTAKSIGEACPDYTVPISGGGRVTGAEGYVALEQNAVAYSGTGWGVFAQEISPTTDNWQIQTDAVCGELLYASNVSESPLGDTTQARSVSVGCDPGHFIVGGGGETFGGDVLQALTAIGPTGASSNTWSVDAYDFEGSPSAESWELWADATCSEAGDFIRVTETTAWDSTSPKQIVALCPPETVPVGGGARMNGGTGSTAIRASYPQELFGEHPIGWTGVADEVVPTAGSWSLVVDAICAPIAEPGLNRWNMIGRWMGNGNTSDQRGGPDGILNNGAGFAPGVVDDGFSLDSGSDQWVEIPGGFYPEGSFSISVWIETDTLQPGTVTEVVNLVDSGGPNVGGANTSRWGIRLDDQGRATSYFADRYSSGAATVGPGVSDLSDGKPHHIVLIRNLEDRVARLYVDGVLEASDTIPSMVNDGLLEPGGSTPDPIAVGVARNANATTVIRPFHGIIDDLQLYDRAITRDEIENVAGCHVPILPRVINLDANRFADPPGFSNQYKLCAELPAGIYEVTLVSPAEDERARHTAWASSETSDWGTVWAVRGEVDPGTAGGIPVGSFPTAQQAFDGTTNKDATFTLNVDQKVYFSLIDTSSANNRGGVSLKVEYVPEPSAAAMCIAGAAFLAACARRRRRR